MLLTSVIKRVSLAQVALVAGAVYTGVQVLSGVLFLATRDEHGNGYFPSNGMVTCSALYEFVSAV